MWSHAFFYNSADTHARKGRSTVSSLPVAWQRRERGLRPPVSTDSVLPDARQSLNLTRGSRSMAAYTA